MERTNSTDYSALVNTERIRSTLRRTFSGATDEVLGELLQNSQRAGAARFDVVTGTGMVRFEDDGHGLVHGTDSLHALLCIAESRYERPEVADQHPMGVGLNALLAHSQVREVVIVSNGLSLAIDVERWWADPRYYTTWADRVETTGAAGSGFRLDVIADDPFVEEVARTLRQQVPWVRDWKLGFGARGYEGVLDVFLNGTPVDTSLPSAFTYEDPLFQFDYQGCTVSVAWEPGKRSCVVWYGQVIALAGLPGGFAWRLDVRQGRPVTPKAPTRRGIVEDVALRALLAGVHDRIFAWVFDPANRERVTPALLEACFLLDRDRAVRESPMFTARRCVPSGEISITCFNDIDLAQPPPEIFRYDDPPPMVAPWVNVSLPGEAAARSFAYGVESFAAILDHPVWFLSQGDESRLTIRTVWWAPGAALDAVFHEPGQWGLGLGADAPCSWRETPDRVVRVFDEPSNWSVEDPAWVVAGDPKTFYERDSWAAFDDRNDDAEWYEMEESYRASICACVRQLIGPSVRRDFTLDELECVVGGKVEAVRWVRNTPGNRPDAVEVTTGGSAVVLRLYGS